MIVSATEVTDFEGEINKLAFDNPFACRIISLFNCYPPELAFVDYWLTADENGVYNGAIARNGSNFILLLTDNSGLEEISSFLRVSGASGVLCSGDFSLDITGAVETNGYVLKSPDIEYSFEENKFIEPDIKAAYELIVKCADENFVPPPFDEFYVDVNHKLRHNAARLYGIEESESLAAAAMTVAESEKGAVLGAVACAPEYRRSGYGSAIVKYIVNKLKSENKTVYLHRAKNANAAFYESLGLEECGTWKEYRF